MAVNATGKVKRVYAASDGAVYIRLEGLAANVTPKEGYFRLQQNHPNRAALYSLLLLAAEHRYDLWIRAVADITPQAHAEVGYMVVDW